MQTVKESIGNGNGKEEPDNGPEFIEERKEMIEELFERTEDYIKTNVQLLKLKAVDRVAEVISTVVAKLATVILGFFFLLMINLGIAIWLGNLMGATHYGFMVVAGFYLLLTIIIMATGKNLIKKPISNSIITQMLK
jgi:hypothetical protein